MPQSHVDRQFRLLRRCLRLPLDLAGLAGLRSLHRHHAFASPQRGEAPPPGLRRGVRGLLPADRTILAERVITAPQAAVFR